MTWCVIVTRMCQCATTAMSRTSLTPRFIEIRCDCGEIHTQCARTPPSRVSAAPPASTDLPYTHAPHGTALPGRSRSRQAHGSSLYITQPRPDRNEPSREPHRALSVPLTALRMPLALHSRLLLPAPCTLVSSIGGRAITFLGNGSDCGRSDRAVVSMGFCACDLG